MSFMPYVELIANAGRLSAHQQSELSSSLGKRLEGGLPDSDRKTAELWRDESSRPLAPRLTADFPLLDVDVTVL